MKMNRRLIILLLFIPPAFFIDPDIQSRFILIKENIQNYYFIRLIDNLMDIIGNGGYQAIFCGLLFIIGKYYYKENLSYFGKYGLFSLLTSSVIVQLLKHLIGRARPRVGEVYLFLGPTMKDGFDSFPSGHTIGAFTLATIFSNVYPQAGWIIYSLAASIGLWRLYDNSHFLSDVFAGAFLGIVVGKLFLKYYPFKRKIEATEDESGHDDKTGNI